MTAANYSSTVARATTVLQLLGTRPDGLSITEIAASLDSHRAGVYRLLNPLVDARLVRRTGRGAYVLGYGLVELASLVEPQLRRVAEGHLRWLAEKVGATTALNVRHGAEMVMIAKAEPSEQVLRVSYPPGHRHPVSRGAAGLAVLAGNPPEPNERPEIVGARARGYAVSVGDLLPGATGIAAPLTNGHGAEGSVSAVWVAGTPPRTAPALVVECVERILADLRQ
ncbi:helix-turn-helix domain-containing protein [Okibacterium endophyticum]